MFFVLYHCSYGFISDNVTKNVKCLSQAKKFSSLEEAVLFRNCFNCMAFTIVVKDVDSSSLNIWDCPFIDSNNVLASLFVITFSNIEKAVNLKIPSSDISQKLVCNSLLLNKINRLRNKDEHTPPAISPLGLENVIIEMYESSEDFATFLKSLCSVTADKEQFKTVNKLIVEASLGCWD